MKTPMISTFLLLACSVQSVLGYIDSHASNGAKIEYFYDYFATPPASASKKCALVNFAMDESGSMYGEQDFLRQTAIPNITKLLYSSEYNYDHVFYCSHGYGRGFAVDSSWYRFIGCSRGDPTTLALQETNITNWYHYGWKEDGYAAIQKSIINVTGVIEGYDLVQECATMDKNMILITDEDRDIEDHTYTMESTRDMLVQYGYLLNAIIPVTFDNDLDNIGVRISEDGNKNEVFAADGSGGWGTKLFNKPTEEFATNNYGGGSSLKDYSPLVKNTKGAIWNIETLRHGKAGGLTHLVESFTNAFINIKANEIACAREGVTCEPCLGTDCDPTITEYMPTESPTSSPTSGPTSSPTAPTSGPTSQPTTTLRGTTGSNINIPDPPGPPPATPPANPPSDAGSKGDPHFKTWEGEHFEFHGQCDLILAKDEQFANGLGLNVQIRTKLVRYWSYIKSAAIRIGDDILEVEGFAGTDSTKPTYWYNFAPQGKATTVGGFPLTITTRAGPRPIHRFIIDLDSKYPGQQIVIETMKEFVRVDFKKASAEAYGKTVGILGDFKTGKTLGRDQQTVIDDFNTLGNEWQVLPADDMLFHEVSSPQFPEPCLLPEDPRGERRRRLGEKGITMEQAEEACSKNLKDALDIKDCVYDILATQDMDMVGAF